MVMGNKVYSNSPTLTCASGGRSKSTARREPKVARKDQDKLVCIKSGGGQEEGAVIDQVLFIPRK